MKKKHLITVDELRAAGALDVPEGWRKSLGNDKNLFACLDDNENEATDNPRQPASNAESGEVPR